MRFKIQNIGKIGYADIVIDGLTVIAGENNTGKSTIGKSLFCFYHGLNRWQNEYLAMCTDRVFDIVSNHIKGLDNIIGGGYYPPSSKVKVHIKDFFSQADVIRKITDEQRRIRTGEIIVTPSHPLMVELDEFIKRYAPLFKGSNVKTILENKLGETEDWKRRLIYALRDGEQLFEEYLEADYIEANFKRYFKNQYRSLYYSDEPCFCILEEEGGHFRIDLREVGSGLDQVFHTDSRVFFIDSPVVYDRMAVYGESVRGNTPQELMDNILVPNFEIMQREKELGGIPAYDSGRRWSEEKRKKVDQLLKEIRNTVGGTSEWSKEGFRFAEKDGITSIYPHNVSSGIKHLALLEYILQERLINPGDILILDEPEINMHPDWQLKYAKVLILLEKELGVKLVITTHSPFFIRAMECYTDIYGQMDDLNIYRSSLDEEGRASFENVMESEWGTPMLYEDYGRQYDELQEMLDEKYGG